MKWFICRDGDVPGECHTERNKSEREKQISYINAYIWNLERWYWWTYLQGGSGDADVENRPWTQWGKERLGRIERVAWRHVHYHVEIDTRRGFAVWHRELSPVFCETREGWDGEGDNEGVRKERTYVYLWLTHGDVQQKPTQYCKAIILQLK